MNVIRRLLRLLTLPFRSLWISLAILCLLIALTAWKVVNANHERRARLDPPVAAQAAPPAGASAEPPPLTAPPPPNTQSKDPVTQMGQNIVNLVLPEQPEQPGNEPPVIPKRIRDAMITPPMPISIGAYKPTPKPVAAAPAPVYYLPSFRRIPCMLVNAAETGSTELPLIAIVTEDQYNIDKDGVSRLVVPAGVEVHGSGQQSPMRDRITSSGEWTFVWRTHDKNNSRELRVAALALNRDFDSRTGIYGSTDGSAGLLGERLEVEDEKEIKSLALKFVAATTRALQSQQSMLNPLTNTIVTSPKPGLSNALIEGASSTVSNVAQQIDKIRENIERDRVYIAVLPGKEFYLYTKQPIDLTRATGPAAPAPAAAPLATTTPPAR
jgi:hypothetical protein